MKTAVVLKADTGMKRKVGILTAGLILLTCAQTQAFTINGLTATDTDVGNITLSATLAGVGAAGGMIISDMTLTNGMLKTYYMPDTVTAGASSWNSTNWNPYFRGIFQVTATPIDFASGPGTPAVINHEVGAARAISGILNSMAYLTQTNYSATGTWANLDTSKVKLHCIGYNADVTGAGSVGCNLLNATVDLSSETDPDVIEALFSDTSAQYPLGTHFRFDVGLHKKPSTFMGMGEIQRYVWTPVDTNAPNASGTLTLDIDNCSPWRSGAATPLGAHVGFAPIFFEDSEMEEEFGGTVMNTTAHYTDVSPSMDESNRVGLVVNGHPGATNYLSVFMPDTLLQTWGVTNAETQMNGYLNGIAINHDLMQFTRIEGGSNVVYDVNGDGVGDSGYVIEFGFFFPATTSLKAAAANSVTAEIGVMSEIQYVEGDFDGDGKADPFWPAKSGVLGMWTFWMSSDSYRPSGPHEMSVPGSARDPVVGDFDGDGKADPAMVNNGSWTFWMSSDSYRPSGPYVMMGRGLDPIPVAADFDGDRKADPAMVVNGGWMFWFSSDSYRPSGPYEMSVSGEHVKPVAGDFDGDRKADPAMVANGDWTFWLSSDSYVSSGPYAISATGTDVQPIVGDFDGDGLADPAMVDLNDNYNWTIWPSGDKYVPVGPYEFVP